MKEVEKDSTRFLVSRRGKPKVVIISVEDYLKNIIKQPKLLAKVQLSAGKANQTGISDSEIEAEISAYRKDKNKGAKKRTSKLC